ncbi:hypothetical protein Tco_0457659 [Tanacetum coccineum]
MFLGFKNTTPRMKKKKSLVSTLLITNMEVIAQQLQNIIPNIVTQVTNNLNNGNGNGNGGGNNGCTYKGFVACGPRDFYGTGGAVALTRWIEKMESVIDNSGCLANQRVKYVASSFIGKALTWWNTQVQARGRDSANAMAWDDFKLTKTITISLPKPKIHPPFQLLDAVWLSLAPGRYAFVTILLEKNMLRFMSLTAPEALCVLMLKRSQCIVCQTRSYGAVVEIRVVKMSSIARVAQQVELNKYEHIALAALLRQRILEIVDDQQRHVEFTLDLVQVSDKGRVKLRRVRAMSMTIQSSVKDKILATSSETSKVENAPAEMLRDLDQQMEKRADDERVKPKCVRAMAMTIQYGVRGMILTAQSEAFKQENVPLVGSEMDEAHASRSPVLWAEIGESSLTGPELVLDTTYKVVLTKEKLITARDRQKSYVNNRRKLLEFEVGYRVMLKVSHWKGVIRFGKKGKLTLRYVGPFEIHERIGPVAYRLRLPEELSGVHNTFHVSNLKKCLADASLHVPLDEIKVDKALRFAEEPVEIMDSEVKSLKRCRILLFVGILSVVLSSLGSARII